MATATVVEPLTTRETVALETPARRATASRVGRSRVTIKSLQAVAPDDVRIPPRAVLRQACLRRVVDVHDAEPLGVPLRPFIVVHQRPHEVSPEVNTAGQCIVAGAEVPVQVLDAIGVVNLAA